MGEALEIKVDTGVKKIKVNDYGDYITINIMDASTVGKFAKMLQSLESVSRDYQSEVKNYKESHKEIGDPLESVIDSSRMNLSYVDRCISVIDDVFGADAVRKVYRECYENDPNFVPDENALLSFVNSVIPIMSSLFQERFEMNRKSYSVRRRGRNSDIREKNNE